MIRSADLRSHYDEMVHFLMGCTVKNEALIRLQNEAVRNKGYAFDEDDPPTWKYWLNIQGLHHVSDWVPHPVTGVMGDIHVKSLDRPDVWIPFTPDSLDRNYVTRQDYLIHRPSFRRLITAYPAHADLIKNVLHPVSENGLGAAMEAPHLTLLRWPGSDPERSETSYLETNELPSIIQDLEDYLDYVRERWYKSWLARIEPPYDPVFWGNLWQHLLARIAVSRIENMNTAQASSFHVWEYLKSTGIGDYRDVLTNRQALFLYRNMRYILDNRGRQSNLRLLVDDLLREESVSVVSKTVYQETETLRDDCEWRTEFVSEPVVTDRSVFRSTVREPQDVTTVIRQLFDSDEESRTDVPYVETMRKRLAATTFNRYSTKLLELESFRRDSQYRVMFFNLFFDTLVYFIQNNLIRETVALRDPESGITLSMNPKDMLILMSYASRRVLDPATTPFLTPSTYTVFEGPFLHNVVAENLPTTLTYRGQTDYITQYVQPVGGYDIPATSPEALLQARQLYLDPLHAIFRVNGNPISEFFFTSAIASEETYFTTVVGKLFEVALRRRRELRTAASGQEIFARTILLNESRWDDRFMPLTLTPHPTYAEWLADPENSDAASLIAYYEERDNFQKQYRALFHRFLQIALDYNDARVQDHISVEGETRRFVGRLRELFIQLCSYNVLFLNTGDDDVVLWTYVPVTRFDRRDLLVSREERRYMDIVIEKIRSTVTLTSRRDIQPFQVKFTQKTLTNVSTVPLEIVGKSSTRNVTRSHYLDPLLHRTSADTHITRYSRMSVTPTAFQRIV